MNKLFWTSQKIKRVGERRKIEHIDEFICHQCINDKTIQTGTCIFRLGSKNLLRTAQMYMYEKLFGTEIVKIMALAVCFNCGIHAERCQTTKPTKSLVICKFYSSNSITQWTETCFPIAAIRIQLRSVWLLIYIIVVVVVVVGRRCRRRSFIQIASADGNVWQKLTTNQIPIPKTIA